MTDWNVVLHFNTIYGIVFILLPHSYSVRMRFYPLFIFPLLLLLVDASGFSLCLYMYYTSFRKPAVNGSSVSVFSPYCLFVCLSYYVSYNVKYPLFCLSLCSLTTLVCSSHENRCFLSPVITGSSVYVLFCCFPLFVHLYLFIYYIFLKVRFSACSLVP